MHIIYIRNIHRQLTNFIYELFRYFCSTKVTKNKKVYSQRWFYSWNWLIKYLPITLNFQPLLNLEFNRKLRFSSYTNTQYSLSNQIYF